MDQHVHRQIGDAVCLVDSGFGGLGAHVLPREDRATVEAEANRGRFEDQANLVMAVIGMPASSRAARVNVLRSAARRPSRARAARVSQLHVAGAPGVMVAVFFVSSRVADEPMTGAKHRWDVAHRRLVKRTVVRNQKGVNHANGRAVDAAHEVVPDVDVGDVGDDHGAAALLADLNLAVE